MIPIVSLVVLLLICLAGSISAQGGSGNNGPIFLNVPGTLDQNKLWAQFPMIESWMMGEWELSYIFQHSENYNFSCGKLYVAKLAEGESGVMMVATHKLENGTINDRIISGERSTKLLPGKYYIDSVTNGLIADSHGPFGFALWGNEMLTLLSLTINTPHIDKTYQTIIYSVNIQRHIGETYPFGNSQIIEVGILSRNGTIFPNIKEHFFSIFENLLPGRTLKEVSC